MVVHATSSCHRLEIAAIPTCVYFIANEACSRFEKKTHQTRNPFFSSLLTHNMAIMHSDLFAFFSRKLPDEQLLYHSPLPPYRHYEPPTSQFVAQKLILSLTPTEGVYEALTAAESKRIRTVVFLHRPFSLDRKRVPVGPEQLV